MYSQFRDNIWNRIQMKNIEMNRNRNCDKLPMDNSSITEWDLSQIEIREERTNVPNIPTIDLEEDDEIDRSSVRHEAPLRGFEIATAHPCKVRTIPINVQRATASGSSPIVDAENRFARRSIHDNRGFFEGIPKIVTESSLSPAPAGIIFNRVYNKKSATPKENYFSILDTPPSPGVLSAASIFGERPVSTEPKIVMTANHYEKKIIRRSFDKPTSATTDNSSRQKNSGPYKLLGVIDLEPDTDSETTEHSQTPSTTDNSRRSVQSMESRKIVTPTNSALFGCPATPRSSKVGSIDTNTGSNKFLTIEIDEDEDHIDEEDTRMELSEAGDEQEISEIIADEPIPGTSKTRSGEELQVDQCTLTDSDTSSTAQMNPSSLANSFCDVSSSGCVKMSGDNTSSANRTNKHTEFDLLLDKINQQVPAMSQQDRVEHWRVTKEDLLYSIPTVAEIETGTSVKRSLDDPIHISSSNSSDSETSDSPSLLRVKQQRAKFKKRRIGTNEIITARSPSLHLGEDLDFRRSQINPEIDKRSSMIQLRKNYYKFPTRFKQLLEEDKPAEKCREDPYVNFLNNDSEKDTFADYLRRNPAYRPDIQTQRQQIPVEENKVAVVVLSPIELQQSNEPSNNCSFRQQPDRPASADRISRYGKNRTKSVRRTLRYKVRKPQLKKKSIMIVPSNLRSYRRLIVKSSLRNGKVRKKQSFVNLINGSKQKRQKRRSTQVESTEHDPQLSGTKPAVQVESVQKESNREPLAQVSRVSVDSAVSSSTSAEQKKNESLEVGLVSVPTPIELRTMKNPLSRTNGEVLMVFYYFNKLIVVQQELVSFWECSKLSTLLGLKQDLQLIGQIKRAQADSQIDASNTNRLGFNEDEPFYLEPRARNLDEDEARTCPLASIYINCYFIGTNEDDKEARCIRMKSLQLDSVRSELSNIVFATLPRSRYFIICWHEQLSETEFRTGLCKYSLTPDLETLASIREFPTVMQKILSLKCIDDSRLIGLGSTTIAIWNYDNGSLIFTVDLKIDIQIPLATFTHTENNDSALFLVQLCPSLNGNQTRKLIKVIGINMSKRSWHLVHSYEVPLESNSILCESATLNSTSLHCTTFQSGELLAISLDDLTTCFSNHKRLQGPDGKRVTRDNVATREKIFLHPAENRQLVLVSDKFIKLNTLDEYSLVCR